MSNLPSPRTLEQGMRDLMVNALGLMDMDQLRLVHAEIGAFCMEVLLDHTLLNQAPPAPPAPPAPMGNTLGVRQTRDLLERFQRALGDDWNEAKVREIACLSSRQPNAVAAHILTPPKGYCLTKQIAANIEDYLNERN